MKTQSLSNFDRRSFLKGALATGALTLCAPDILRAASRGDKVRLACVGIGNRGGDVIRDLHKTGLAAGMKVAVNPSHPCGKCPACRSGRENLCERMHFLGSASVFPHAQGMFADLFILGSRQVIPVDTG